jgi:hypothetical protein
MTFDDHYKKMLTVFNLANVFMEINPYMEYSLNFAKAWRN